MAVNSILKGILHLPETHDIEIAPGIFLIGEPVPRPDLGPMAMACLANVHGCLAVVQLSISFTGKEKS